MEHRFCLDEILMRIEEMIKDGYHYGSIEVLEDCEFENGQKGAVMVFSADDEGGFVGVDYEDLQEVPFEEVEEFAYCGKFSAPGRVHVVFREEKN